MAQTMIIRDSAGNFYRVEDHTDPRMAHVWLGYPVTRTRTGFVIRRNAGAARLVRKAGAIMVAA